MRTLLIIICLLFNSSEANADADEVITDGMINISNYILL